MATSSETITTDVGGHRHGPRLWLVIIFLMLLTLFVRLPYFFPAVTNWDESTFILAGQNILNNNLPLVDLWDFKPPVGFAIFAGIIAIMGKSILAVRLAGALFVAGAALLVYSIGHRIWHWPAGLAAAGLLVITVTLMPSGSTSVMLEHLAIVPLLGALLLLTSKAPSAKICFLAGVLTMLATMIRLNLALVPVLIGFYILLVPSLRPLVSSIRRGLAFASGNALVLALSFMPYLLTGHHTIWLSTLVTGPLLYNSGDTHLLSSVDSQKDIILGGVFKLPSALVSVLSGVPIVNYEAFGRPLLDEFAPSLVAFLLACAAAGGLLGLIRWRSTDLRRRQAIVLIILMLVATELSVILTGSFSYHYLIQVIPFLCLFAGLFIGDVASGRGRPAAALAIAVFIVLSLGPLLGEYALLAKRTRSGLPLPHGAAYEIVDYLRENGDTSQPIYLMDDHIAYWFLDQEPLSPVTLHPSTIANEGLLRASGVADPSPKAQLAYVLDQHPTYIVTRDDLWYLDDHPALMQDLKDRLAADYELVKRIDVPLEASTMDIYRRTQISLK